MMMIRRHECSGMDLVFGVSFYVTLLGHFSLMYFLLY